MLVTALSSHIGYDRSAEIVKLAQQQNCSLREAALQSGHVTAAEFDAWVEPRAILRGGGPPDHP